MLVHRSMDRLTEYDYIVKHRPCKSNIMRLADGMSRMPGLYSQYAVAEDEERMAMTTVLRPHHLTIATLPNVQTLNIPCSPAIS